MPPTATLFVNGRILTGEQLLSPQPRTVSALLAAQGLVVATGTVEGLRRQAPPGTEEIDLRGAFAMPGFNDAHLHLGEGARLRREVDLRGTQSLDEALERIRRFAAASAGTWLTGGGWDETVWPGHPLPSRYDLDRVTSDRPALFARIDVHLAVANSAALDRAAITRATPSPPGGAIDHDPRGEPTGILRERAARELVERHIPPASLAERMDALRGVLRDALACGITSVQDNSTDEDFRALRALHAAGELPLRVAEWLPFDHPLEELEQRRAEAPQDRFLRTTMLKAFLDGSLGSRTAALLAPYADAPGTRGLALYEQQTLDRLACERAAAGFQLGFHAIGDRAFAMALAAFQAVQAESGRPDARFRIEHAQTAAADGFAMAARGGVVASMQPNHLLTDMRWARERLGPERAQRAYSWRSFLAAGAALAFGTDFPVEPLTPFRGLYAATTRRSEAGDTVFHPEQGLQMTEALHAYTQGSAFAERAEHWKGILCPGAVADMAVLDRDLLALPDPRAVLATRTMRTVVGGQTVYQAPGA